MAVTELVKQFAGRVKAPSGVMYMNNDDYIFGTSPYENTTLREDRLLRGHGPAVPARLYGVNFYK
ncbi:MULTISPECIES: hypothetical protein [Pyrobaculum]|uniref:Uncharacterized protein n=1 Tax=Pyrobaculum arsenaticum TaxID=121277 RepID=A0A7L4PBS1_9CREN|nr:hypothetical protein [Pyrobaculum arsenaticum]NYR15897.1 hypothetical protein [Pyrobaculum arsenaticum]